MVVQLAFLGIVLVPLFTYSRWWMVLLYALFMTAVAAVEAAQRPAFRYQVRAGCATHMAAPAVLPITSWHSPQPH